MVSDDVVERMCIRGHDAYEAAAQKHGWNTQDACKTTWHDLPEANKKAMRAGYAAAIADLKPGDKVGDGCVVVPVEPTGEMGLAFKERYEHEIAEGFRAAYLNMLAALDTGET